MAATLDTHLLPSHFDSACHWWICWTQWWASEILLHWSDISSTLRHIKSGLLMASKRLDPAKEGEEASEMTLGQGWEDKEDIIKGIQPAEDNSEVWANFKDEGAASEGGARAECLQGSDACKLDGWVYMVPIWALEVVSGKFRGLRRGCDKISEYKRKKQRKVPASPSPNEGTSCKEDTCHLVSC